MSLRPESEIAAIRHHLENLKKARWMDAARQWWPTRLFHSTDINNAVSILRSGELLRRVEVEKSGSLAVDIASREVISQTDPRWKEYVRFYFRPRTPTQYRNEGFRPRHSQELQSHCPVPVYLIFDAIPVISMAESQFTDGNAGVAGVNPSKDVNYLERIPFHLVYHDSAFLPAERSVIVYHRNAEVMVPNKVGLETLRFIGCRSSAEYETLLHLLPPGVRSRWIDKIGVRPEHRLFHQYWTFVDRCELSAESIIFRFNPSTKTPGPFHARVEITDPGTGKRYSWERQDYRCNNRITLSLQQVLNPLDYTVRLTLDGQLAYANRYQAEDLPF